MLLANFGGCGNITYLGGEVKDPSRNIPRAIVLSIGAVAVLYLLMRVTIIGTIGFIQPRLVPGFSGVRKLIAPPGARRHPPMRRGRWPMP
ncbi:MAG: amino acid permease [Terriglobia bacterium]|jgi:amino acid transporter